MTALELAEGIELGYALVARVAEDIGARALAIKGLVNEAHDLRTPRPSADVDVLVEPDRLADLVGALIATGWRNATPVGLPSAFEEHSVTLNHPAWPCEIDLHDRYPGFLADRADVFDVLWLEHTFLMTAGVAVPATGIYGTALIMALHALRSPRDPRSGHELRGLVNRLLARGVNLERLRRFAVTTGSLGTARPFLTSLGISVPRPDGNDPQLAAWDQRRTVVHTRNLGWLLALRRTPP